MIYWINLGVWLFVGTWNLFINKDDIGRLEYGCMFAMLLITLLHLAVR